MTTTYLPDLSHRAPEARWLPSDLPTRLTADWVAERYDEMIAATQAAGDDADAWVEIVQRVSELEAYLGSQITRVRMAYRQDTDDQSVADEYRRINHEIVPVVTDKSVEISRAVVASPSADHLADTFGEIYLKQEEATCRAHAPVNTELRTKLSDVLMDYTKIFGKGTIEWKGKTWPFSYARRAALDSDTEQRHAAWRSKVDYVKSHDDELNRIYDEARNIRGKMAENLGMKSYVELRYLEMGRYEYGPDDVAKVRHAIKEHVAPVAERFHSEQARALGVEKLHPADININPAPAPELIVDVDEQLDVSARIFSMMGPNFAEPWTVLQQENLIDLPAREGKGTGASCSTFPYEKVPYLFCNSVGSHDDIKTLMHEFGHAMQCWRSRDIEPIQLRSPTLEACEIHSMTLELLVHPHMEGFFGKDEGVYRREHLRSTLITVPYMAAIDEFQHRIYDEGLDAQQRGDVWREIDATYWPGVDWGADEWFARNRWLMQLHVFQSPFYYIDYALARLVSWELWLNSLEDESAAIDTYLKLCSAGGTKSFRTLVTDAGLGDPFDETVIKNTMQRLERYL